jgi:hypothetical protein
VLRLAPPLGLKPTAPRVGPPGPALDLDRALLDPGSVFRSPDEVLRHPALVASRKREILRRWLWDARLLEAATSDRMPEGEPSRLEEIVRALLALDDAPDAPPAAAAFAVALETDELRLAA